MKQHQVPIALISYTSSDAKSDLTVDNDYLNGEDEDDIVRRVVAD